MKLAHRGCHAADFMLAASTICSGNHFNKISFLTKLMGLKPLQRSFFYDIQHEYAAPAIDRHWEKLLKKNLDKYPDKIISCIAGDGRMDSPGHSGEICSANFNSLFSSSFP